MLTIVPTEAMIQSVTSYITDIFKPGTPGFLELLLSTNVCMHVCVCMCLRVCPPPRLLITSGMMWCDIDRYDRFNKFYGLYMAALVGIVSGHNVSIHTHCGN